MRLADRCICGGCVLIHISQSHKNDISLEWDLTGRILEKYFQQGYSDIIKIWTRKLAAEFSRGEKYEN